MVQKYISTKQSNNGFDWDGNRCSEVVREQIEAVGVESVYLPYPDRISGMRRNKHIKEISGKSLWKQNERRGV